MKKITESLFARFEEIEGMDYDDIHENAELIYDLERDLREATRDMEILFEGSPDDFESPRSMKVQMTLSRLKSLAAQIARLKRDNDFYDPEATLDMMFPNRHDDDFDEDSMSYDSVFGDD